ncbi:hypothetical protein AABB24_009631 [Solanum stoloniferum]
MDSGDGSSVPRRRTRQQFLKYCLEFIEERNKSTEDGNTRRKTTKLEEKNTCIVGGEKPKTGKKKVDSGKRNKSTQNGNTRRKIIKFEEKNTCFGGGEKSKMEKKVDSGKKKFTCESIQEISDSDDDVVIIGDGSADSSGSGSSSNVGLRAIEDVSSSEEPIDVEKLKDFVDPLKSQQDEFTDATESEASSDEDK